MESWPILGHVDHRVLDALASTRTRVVGRNTKCGSPQALEGGHALQEHSGGFRFGRRSRAVLVPWNAGSWYHILLVTTLVRELRETFCQEEHFFKVDERERSRTPRNTKGPLVPSEPRRVSDGDGRCALLLDGGDGSEQVVKSSGSGLGSCPVSFKSGNRRLITGRSLPTEEERNPPIVPIRGCLEQIRIMLKGYEYIGSGSSQRGLGRSSLCNTHKVSVCGRKLAAHNFTEGIHFYQKLREHLPRLAGKRLVCHCLPTHECHADSIIAEYKLLYLEACDREDANGALPSSAVLTRLAQLRLEPDSSEGSSPDEGAQKKGSGWTGRGRPLLVASSYTVREICDGQSLASTGRWAHDCRRSIRKKEVVEIVGSRRPLRVPGRRDRWGSHVETEWFDSQITEHASWVKDVLKDQNSRGQILKLPEAEARLQFTHLVVPSLGAQRKDKPGGLVSARVLFDGPNGIPVNRRIRLRDQERAPVASHLKRCIREKALRKEQTFSLTADVAEAHGQVPVNRRAREAMMCSLIPLGRMVSLPLRTSGRALPHRLDGLLNIFQDGQPLRGINWRLAISTSQLGQVIIEPH